MPAGFPEEIIETIFEPYFTTKEKREGAGLGLYMSKKIIDEHFKGEFLVKNGLKGACFEIRLPIEE